jgi:aminoglycoside 2'-N-acetyltransferase I
VHVLVAPTADLDGATLSAARALLDSAFRTFDDEDWAHALGGTHALAWDGSDLVGHASLVARRLLYGGRWLRTGYVEAVAVRDDRRREGIASLTMDALEAIVRRRFELGALSSSRAGAPLYVARGWQRWLGPTSVSTPAGEARTVDDDGSIFVLPVGPPLDLGAPLACDWREGDVW